MRPADKFIQDLLVEVDFYFQGFLNATDLGRHLSVETEAGILADKKAWQADELDAMKAIPLADIEYQDIDNVALFKVKSTSTDTFVSLSNRMAHAGEMRAVNLRKALNQLKAHHPTMSLYEALNHIVKDPQYLADMVYFINALGRSENFDKSERENQHARITAAFAALSSLCMELLNEAEKNKQLQPMKDELIKNKQKIIAILGLMNPEEIQFAFSSFVLEKTVEHLDAADLRKTANQELLAKVQYIKAQYPADTALLAKVLWQSYRQLRQPENPQVQTDFLNLSQEVGKRQWGKIIAGAMLGVVFVSAFAACCASGFGAIAALPLLAYGLSYFLAATTASAVITAGALSLFADGVKANKEREELARKALSLFHLHLHRRSHEF